MTHLPYYYVTSHLGRIVSSLCRRKIVVPLDRAHTPAPLALIRPWTDDLIPAPIPTRHARRNMAIGGCHIQYPLISIHSPLAVLLNGWYFKLSIIVPFPLVSYHLYHCAVWCTIYFLSFSMAFPTIATTLGWGPWLFPAPPARSVRTRPGNWTTFTYHYNRKPILPSHGSHSSFMTLSSNHATESGSIIATGTLI